MPEITSKQTVQKGKCFFKITKTVVRKLLEFCPIKTYSCNYFTASLLPCNKNFWNFNHLYDTQHMSSYKETEPVKSDTIGMFTNNGGRKTWSAITLSL